MRDIKLIALDMDGTLLTSDHQITDYTREVISKALEQDIHVVLSTGRWLKSCYPFAESLQLTSYLVTCNGGEIWTVSKELVEQHLFEADKMENLWKLGHDIGVRMWLVSTDGVFYDDPPADFHAYQWLKIGYRTDDNTKLAKVKAGLANFDELELSNSLPTNIEVNPVGVNKANALTKVCEKLGITMDQVLAAGDSLNDLNMIKEAGIGVAMGNAQDVIKDVADFVTDTNDNDGVAKAIERFVLSK